MNPDDGGEGTRFTLFGKETFDVTDPEALIEAYCFQSDFYSKYDLNRPRDDRSYERLGSIGARTTGTSRDKCIGIIARHKDFALFKMTLDSFLTKPEETRSQLTSKFAEITAELDDIPDIRAHALKQEPLTRDELEERRLLSF